MDSPIRVASITFKNWAALALENDFVRIVVIPEIGGKVVSIESLSNHREFLWQDDTRPYRHPRYGDVFGNYDASGFDECFPSIGECDYPEFPWDGVRVPDHGEMWCTPWRAEPDDKSVHLDAHGVRFPYHFEKSLTLAANAPRCTITYRVTNPAPFDFKYCWSAHPLFAASEGMCILLPDHPDARLVFALGNRVAGDLQETYRWPWLRTPAGEMLDYSRIGSPALAANDKVYVDVGDEGWCALYDPTTGDFVGFRFAPELIPYLGICVNHGAYPFEGAKGFWVALEPCTGYPDALSDVIALQKHATVKSRSSVSWSLALHVGQADSVAEVRRQLLA